MIKFLIQIIIIILCYIIKYYKYIILIFELMKRIDLFLLQKMNNQKLNKNITILHIEKKCIHTKKYQIFIDKYANIKHLNK